MYSLSRHTRRANMLRPTFHGSGSMLLHGHPVRCMVQPLGSVAKEMKKEDLQETHAHQVMLRADVKKLGKMLGYSIAKHSGEGVFQKVEELRKLARQWRQGGKGGLDALNDRVAKFTVDEMNDVSRAFAHFLTLANTAETHNKVRALRSELLAKPDEVMPVPKRDDSTLGTIERLLKDHDASAQAIYEHITKLKMELVLTAHPTEVNRRTFLNKHKQLASQLEKLNFQTLTPYERMETERAMQAEVTNIWNSDIIRRIKPSPVDEAKGGLAVVEQVLWEAVPNFMRKLDAILELTINKKLPITAAPVKFASWMGGDRDGNPNVTPEITWTVALRSRWQACRLLRKDVRELKMVLSSTQCSDELRNFVGEDVREPYRHVMKELEGKIESNIITIDSLFKPDGGLKPGVAIPELPIMHTSQVLEPLLMLHRSLVATGQMDIADGLLTDTIRRLYTFGVTLLPLDIRQESTRHTETVDAITRYLGIGSYAQWDEETRMSWLMSELNGKRPLLPKERPLAELSFAPEVIDCLETFRAIAEMGGESLGAYVISMAKKPSDVLLVKLLMKEFGLKRVMRVVPLFETLEDLNRSVDTMETLFTNPWYKGRIDGKQEIMIGYSDSSKDAGRLAALWAQYEAQERLATLGDKHGIELTMFHGKGGTVSRGGNPSMYKALVAQPPGTLNNRLRITEQGEMITQNFGHKAVAEATLDVYLAGVLMEGFQTPVHPPPEWRAVMAELSDKGRHHYHATVRHDPIFVPYFRAATPEQELGTANIGSRPQKRRPGGVETLRAIPWVFSWTQTRLHLSAWLGVGEALAEVSRTKGSTLKEMYKQWPYFNTNLDLVDMILAKAEADIAENYDRLLVSDPEQQRLGVQLRDRLKDTTKAVLDLSGNKKLQQNNPVLQWAIIVRNAYADPLNVLQVHLLKRLRNKEYSNDEERQTLQDALVVTINGISAGMRNSG